MFTFIVFLSLFVSCVSPTVKDDVLVVQLGTLGNEIAFDKNLIELEYPRKIRLIFTNQAEHNSEILHNLVILRPGTEERVFKAFQDASYELDEILPHDDILKIGETLHPGHEQVIEFSPPGPGDYPFVCLMPGHADLLGMKGILKVADSRNK